MNIGNETRVIVFTQSHWLTGHLESTNARVQETLKSGSSDFVRLHEVTVSQELQQAPVIVSLPEVLLPKPMVDLVVIPGDNHEAPQKRRNCLIRKVAFDMYLVVAGHSIRGTLHLSIPTTDILRMITSLDDFFALTDVTFIHQSGNQTQARVALINKKSIGCISFQMAGEKKTAIVDPDQSQPEHEESPLDQLLRIPRGMHENLSDSGCRSI